MRFERLSNQAKGPRETGPQSVDQRHAKRKNRFANYQMVCASCAIYLVERHIATKAIRPRGIRKAGAASSLAVRASLTDLISNSI